MNSRILLVSFAFSLILVSSLGFAVTGNCGQACDAVFGLITTCPTNQRCYWDTGLLGIAYNYHCLPDSTCLPNCNDACSSYYGSYYLGSSSSSDSSDSCDWLDNSYVISYDPPKIQTSAGSCYCKIKVGCTSQHVCSNGQCVQAVTKQTCMQVCQQDYQNAYAAARCGSASDTCLDSTYKKIYAKSSADTSDCGTNCYCGYKQSCSSGYTCSGTSCTSSSPTTTYKATTTTLPACSLSLCGGTDYTEAKCSSTTPARTCINNAEYIWGVITTPNQCTSQGQNCYCKASSVCASGKSCNAQTGTCEAAGSLSCSGACAPYGSSGTCETSQPASFCDSYNNKILWTFKKYSDLATGTVSCSTGTNCYCGVQQQCASAGTCSNGQCSTGTVTTTKTTVTTTTVNYWALHLPSGFSYSDTCKCDSGWVPAINPSSAICTPNQNINYVTDPTTGKVTGTTISYLYDYNLRVCGATYIKQVINQVNNEIIYTQEDAVDGNCYTGCKPTTSGCYCIKYADIKNTNPGSCQIQCQNYNKETTTKTTTTITTTTLSNIPAVEYNSNMKLPEGFTNVEGTEFSKCSCDYGWAPASSVTTMNECSKEIGNLKTTPGNLGKCGSDYMNCFANCKVSKTDYTNKPCYCLQIVSPTKKGDKECNTECSGYGVTTSPYKITTTTEPSSGKGNYAGPYSPVGYNGNEYSCTNGKVTLSFTVLDGISGDCSMSKSNSNYGTLDPSCCCKLSTDSFLTGSGYTNYVGSFGTQTNCKISCNELCNKKGYAEGICYGCTGNSGVDMNNAGASCALTYRISDSGVVASIGAALCPSGDESCFCRGTYVATTTTLPVTSTTVQSPCIAAGGNCVKLSWISNLCNQNGCSYDSAKDSTIEKDASGNMLSCDIATSTTATEPKVCTSMPTTATSSQLLTRCTGTCSGSAITTTTSSGYVNSCPTGTDCYPISVLISQCGGASNIISQGSCTAYDSSAGYCTSTTPAGRCTTITTITYNPTTTISTATSVTTTTEATTTTSISTTTVDTSNCTSNYGTCFDNDTELTYCNDHGFGSVNTIAGVDCGIGKVCAKAGYAGCTGTTTTVAKTTTTSVTTTTGTATSLTTTTTLVKKSGSCAGMCGKKSVTCWCDAACVKYGDCCTDAKSTCPSLYASTTTTTSSAQSGSCAGMCGKKSVTCWCDAACVTHGDCCTDAKSTCPSLYVATTTTTFAAATNGGYCTEQLCNAAVKLTSSKYYPSINCATKEIFSANSASAAHCFCDSSCAKTNDCCPDVASVCSWASGKTIASTAYKCQ